jgi:hypothetical protein
MYTLVRSRFRQDRRAGRWKEANLATAAIGSLTANYGDIYLYIEYPGAGEPVLKALHWVNVLNLINNYPPETTVQAWLTAVGNQTLPFEAKLPNERIRTVKYAQAWHVGYDIQARARLGTVKSEASPYYKEDLIINHPDFTPERIRDNCLISVNGYFHLTDWTVDGVRVIDGNTTAVRCNDNQIGLYSFETIGKLSYHRITADMIKPQEVDTPLWDATYLTLPDDVDLKDKTVLLVTGGYLNVLSDVYTRTGDRTWRLSFGKMMFLNRYLQSVKDMDLSSLGLSTSPKDPSLFNVQELKCDRVINAYLQLSQSFFVIVDSPSLFQTFEPVQYLQLPGRFVNAEGKQYPLVGAYGRMLDYHVIDEPNIHRTIVPEPEVLYVYCATENKRYDYDAHHRPWPRQTAVNDGAYPARPFVHETAYYRIIGVEG